MGNNRNKCRTRKNKFKGNRYSNSVLMDNADKVTPTVSESKLKNNSSLTFESETDEQNIIINLQILKNVILCLCCPLCSSNGMNLELEISHGLAVNMVLKCQNCDYSNFFCSSEKVDKMHSINAALVFGMRIVGKGYSAAKKLFSVLNVNMLSKTAYRHIEKKLEGASNVVASNCMKEAALELKSNKNEIEKCGVSVDGTWQRRGHSSLNGCVSVLSISNGKVLDIELMSKMCRFCSKGNVHNCTKHVGSSGAMEPVGVFRIFERSVEHRNLQYVDFYGDGDSKGYDSVKNIYGEGSVTKYECIGHIQKRVGSRLRKLKTKQKGLGGRGKLTDAFIDKLQNYYGIAIRSNVNNLLGMQSAVIAVFFHCCSSSKQPMHGQCPVGPDSWCKFQRAVSRGIKYNGKEKGLPKNVMKVVKPVYMKLCEQELLKKCLHGKTQNANESFNCVLWKYIPKETFVELQTLRFGAYLAVIQFNSGFRGLLEVLKMIGINLGIYTIKGFAELDKERISEAKRHSLPPVKTARKKNRMTKKKKFAKTEQHEGITYKCGEF